MANRTYLVVSDQATIYPSFVEPDFDPAISIIAQAPYCVPLLWMGLFREQDLQRQELHSELGSMRAQAPVVSLHQGLRQLREAIAVLDGLFASGTLSDFYDLLTASLMTADRKFITIELEEVAYMMDPRNFFRDFNLALRAMEGDADLDAGKAPLLAISQLQALEQPTAAPAARCIIEGNYTPDDLAIHTGIIGCQWMRRVHWETDLTIPTEARVNPSMEMIYAALLEVLCCVMSVDGTIAATEKQQLARILNKVGVPWSQDEINERVLAFAKRVKRKGLADVTEAALSHIPMFKRIGRESVLTRCIDLIIEADGIVNPRESDLCQRIQGILRFAER